MGAVEHLKTLCCLGLPPESAMVAVTPVLHEIIPHGWSRWMLLASDATITGGYAENPAAVALYRERLWRFWEDSASPVPLWRAAFHVVGIGWSLAMQGRGCWFDSGWYRELEAPLDSCWFLSAMIGDSGRTIACVQLTRPRRARPFTVDDVQRLDPLRPWLGHAFHKCPRDHALESQSLTAGAPALSGQMFLSSDEKIVFQTPSVEHLLMIIEGWPADFTRHTPTRDKLPKSISMLLQQIVGAASGTSDIPPRIQIPTAYGVVTLEAKWLMPAGALPADVAKGPKSCLISVTIELREHAIAHAVRMLRESGATPAQMKVGVQLALGKTKPTIANELSLKPTTVADLTRKLYQTLDVHNSAELSTKIWLGETREEVHRRGLSGPPMSLASGAKIAPSASVFRS
jgi:DNA-binding CsgD family transcriptional regulator